jgi:L-arabinokinase
MYRISTGSTRNLDDVSTFVEMLSRRSHHALETVRTLFRSGSSLVVARAPGRLDLMGGIADYSGSRVLQLPTREATLAAVQKDAERRIRIVSLRGPAGRSESVFEMPLADFEAGGRPIAYEKARHYFARRPADHWAAYIAGAALVLMRERGAAFQEGFRVLVRSDVPEGMGVSSSAALEVAVMQALSSAYDVPLDPLDVTFLSQMVENLVVGAPCGIMDQMTAVFGQPRRLLSLLCQPAQLQEPIELPDDVSVWGLDSGIRHAGSGSDYRSVRVGAFMGYRMIAALAGLRVRSGTRGETLHIADPLWNSYLANVGPDTFRERFAAHLPETLGGDSFLKDFQGITDPVTAVDPGTEYPVRAPTAHPIYENARVRQFADLLGRNSRSQSEMVRLGQLMSASHDSYSSCGLGTPRTDLLAEMVDELGPRSGLFGAKITGGGSGGTVAVLGRPEAEGAVWSIVERYEAETGHRPVVFTGSSPGAAEFGVLTLQPAAPG